MANLSRLLFIFITLVWSIAQANPHRDQIDQLLTQQPPPSGVVFEIASSDPDALRWAIPLIKKYTDELRQTISGLEVAVVTHGREQFALQESNENKYQEVHDAIKALGKQDEVPVHICETFAGWKDVTAEEFPDYVTVSATGPQQVNDYIDLGYTLVKLRRP